MKIDFRTYRVAPNPKDFRDTDSYLVALQVYESSGGGGGGDATAANQQTQITQIINFNEDVNNNATDIMVKQDVGNTSLASIDTKLTSQATAAKQDTGNTSLASIDTKLTSQATAANQVTGNASLASIHTDLNGLSGFVINAFNLSNGVAVTKQSSQAYQLNNIALNVQRGTAASPTGALAVGETLKIERTLSVVAAGAIWTEIDTIQGDGLTKDFNYLHDPTYSYRFTFTGAVATANVTAWAQVLPNDKIIYERLGIMQSDIEATNTKLDAITKSNANILGVETFSESSLTDLKNAILTWIGGNLSASIRNIVYADNGSTHSAIIIY